MDAFQVYPGLEPEPHLVLMVQAEGELLGQRLSLGNPKEVWRLIGAMTQVAITLWGDPNK
jgi:hypothetical protein